MTTEVYMGTNYFLFKVVKPACDKCHREEECDLDHIAKASFGWRTLVRGDKFSSWSQFVDELFRAERDGANVMNEYGEKMSVSTFISEVCERRAEKVAKQFPDNCGVHSQKLNDDGRPTVWSDGPVDFLYEEFR